MNDDEPVTMDKPRGVRVSTIDSSLRAAFEATAGAKYRDIWDSTIGKAERTAGLVSAAMGHAQEILSDAAEVYSKPAPRTITGRIVGVNHVRGINMRPMLLSDNALLRDYKPNPGTVALAEDWVREYFLGVRDFLMNGGAMIRYNTPPAKIRSKPKRIRPKQRSRRRRGPRKGL